MQFHIVTAGQTAEEIAGAYGVSPAQLTAWNTAPFALGQCLLVLEPETEYTVVQGDTLYGISQATGVSLRTLWQNNPALAGETAIFPGQRLVLSYRDVPTYPAQVYGYAYPFVKPELLRQLLPYAGALVPFTYGISQDGGLVDLNDGGLIAAARDYGVSPWMHLSTLTEAGTFSVERATQVLNNEVMQETLIRAVTENLRQKQYQGMDVDFEFLGKENAAAYGAFVAKLRQAVSPLPLLTALAPKTSKDQPGLLYEGHDYALLAERSDGVLLMTYEWGYTYGPPMAVAPLPSVRRVVEFALTQMPASKIYLGFPNYAYDWPLPFVAGSTKAQSISNEEAVARAVRFGAEIRYDEEAQTPWFTYESEGITHEVWFEDVRSARAKYALVPEYGLKGIGFWNFMRPFRQGFCLLPRVLAVR